jgi:hypothetical protein
MHVSGHSVNPSIERLSRLVFEGFNILLSSVHRSGSHRQTPHINNEDLLRVSTICGGGFFVMDQPALRIIRKEIRGASRF